MALKPTIYKFRIALTDMNRDYYDSFNLTIAQHPSENLQRMFARILAFALNAKHELVFTKGLSNIEEPDLWEKSLDDQILHWVEVGEPDPERIKKACRLAKQVSLYSFNTKGPSWWEKNQGKLKQYPVSVANFPFEAIEELTSHVERTMSLSIMITGQSLFIDGDNASVEVPFEQWHSHE